MTWAALWDHFTDKLADDWRKAWRWFSVQLGALIFVAPTLYENVELLQEFIPRKPFAIVQALLGVLVILNAVKKK